MSVVAWTPAQQGQKDRSARDLEPSGSPGSSLEKRILCNDIQLQALLILCSDVPFSPRGGKSCFLPLSQAKVRISRRLSAIPINTRLRTPPARKTQAGPR